MRIYLVQAYLNVQEDAEGRWQAVWSGYDPAHRIATDEDLLFEVTAESPQDAAERAFVIGNREGEDNNGRRWPSDVRSLSVGDVVDVSDVSAHDESGDTVWACQTVGWAQQPGHDLPNPRVPLAGTHATSRKAYPVSMPEGALTWESQVVQYADAPPPEEPGITYYEGDVSDSFPDKPPIDCLLYWQEKPGGQMGRDGQRRAKLRIVGILNHYPDDYPPYEKAGNVNVWVRKAQQRQGIATALWEEAVRRWNVRLDDQRFTESGSRLAAALDRRGATR